MHATMQSLGMPLDALKNYLFGRPVRSKNRLDDMQAGDDVLERATETSALLSIAEEEE